MALIVAITVVPLGGFFWLGLWLLGQDRALARQQTRDRLQTAADAVVGALQRDLASAEQKLAAADGGWGDGVAAVTFHPDRVEVSPPGRLAYLPIAPAATEVPELPFRPGEALEFVRGDRVAALAVYRPLTTSEDPAVRGGALLRLGRNLRALGRLEDALTAYARLSEMDAVTEARVPLSLASAWARCTILEQQHRDNALRIESDQLLRALHAGRWAVDASTYETYAADARRWAGAGVSPHTSETLAAAITLLWPDRERDLPRSRRQSLVIDGQMLTILWQPGNHGPRAIIAAPSFVESEWLRQAAVVASDQRVAFQIRDAAGRLQWEKAGSWSAGESAIIVSVGQSDLPWTVAVATTGEIVESTFLLRRRLLIAGFALLATLSFAASWLIVRAVTREMALVRLQSDFVAAVSHEFRTPLTTLRQFTDILREQPHLDTERRALCYDAQARATDRLTRLVESVLDFGGMETGGHQYRFAAHDCAALAERVVDDFRDQPQALGRPITFVRDGTLPIEADDEALSRAVWNLLDNAVKYSPDGGPIDVRATRGDGHASIAVRDSGLGIPEHERRAIFSKFQRGEQARTRGIKGTGIGLAIVDQIVKAHGGRIIVESRPGGGSTFSLLIPLSQASPLAQREGV